MAIELLKIDKSELIGKEPILAPTTNVWIAGGAIRQWFCGENKSDIDIFGVNEDSLQQFISTKLVGAVKLTEQKHLSSYSYQGQLVQVIKYKYFNNISELFDSFDFSLCQFAWDGTNVYSTQIAIISVLRKHLRVHKIDKNHASDSLRRAFKYQEKGYKPCHGTILDISLSFVNLTEAEIKEQVTISPNGGTRIIGVD